MCSSTTSSPLNRPFRYSTNSRRIPRRQLIPIQMSSHANPSTTRITHAHQGSTATSSNAHPEFAALRVRLHALRQVVPRLIPQPPPRLGQVRLRPVLRKAVRVLEVIRLEIRSHRPVELRHHLVERKRPPAADVEHAASL